MKVSIYQTSIVKFLGPLCALLFCYKASAQKSFSLGLSVNPSLSWIDAHGAPGLQGEQANYSTSLGLEGNYSLKNMQLTTGILYINLITASPMVIMDVNNEFVKKISLNYHSRAVAIPLRADYIFNPEGSYKLFAGGGMYLGYVFDQFVDQSALKEFAEVPEKEAINLSPDFFLAVNAGLGVKRDIANQLTFSFRPNFLFQVNAHPERPYRRLAAMIDLALSYRI